MITILLSCLWFHDRWSRIMLDDNFQVILVSFHEDLTGSYPETMIEWGIGSLSLTARICVVIKIPCILTSFWEHNNENVMIRCQLASARQWNPWNFLLFELRGVEFPKDYARGFGSWHFYFVWTKVASWYPILLVNLMLEQFFCVTKSHINRPLFASTDSMLFWILLLGRGEVLSLALPMICGDEYKWERVVSRQKSDIYFMNRLWCNLSPLGSRGCLPHGLSVRVTCHL